MPTRGLRLWITDVDEAPVTLRTRLMGLPTTHKWLRTTSQSLTNDHPKQGPCTPRHGVCTAQKGHEAILPEDYLSA